MKTQSLSYRFFSRVTSIPKTIIGLGLLIIIGTAAFIPKLTIDARSESFLPEDNPAIRYREQVEQTFGLKDPMVIVVINKGEHGVFNPQSLQLIQWLTDEVMKMPENNRDRVVSLATEDNITGNAEGMQVEPFFEIPPTTQKDADKVRAAVMNFPLYLGSLVARDGSATLIVTEVYDTNEAPDVYGKLLDLIASAPIQNGENLHVAGDGAVSGYLVTYINADAARLVPVSVVVITLLCIISFRTWRGTIIPAVVIFSAMASALGLMASAGVPVYVITTSMPILLVGVAVADSIHVLSQYYEERANHPEDSQRGLVVRTMAVMWRPVTITTLTSMAGFLGVSISSYMPPMQAFGLFSLIGLGMAGLFSLTFVPAALALLKPINSPTFKSNTQGLQIDFFSRIMDKSGGWVLGNTKKVLFLSIIVSVLGVMGALKLEVNESWIENFQATDAISLADQAINATMDGSNTLDIVVEAANENDLFKPEHLQRIDALQTFLKTLPHVNGSTSIVDYIKQMNRSLHENKATAYTIPDNAELISQYFLLYSASADPTDFEEEIDYDYRMALVRARLDSARYQQNKVVVEATQKYLNETFNTTDIKATLSGRVNVDYEWLNTLLGTQFKSVVFALTLVWLLVCISLRSIYGGTLALIPVLLGTLSVYAFMGITGITLAVGTTMTAAIALGIGIDFAIHTLDRIKLLIVEQELEPERALRLLYPSTGRALLFSFVAVFLGFGILGLSIVPPLSKLGLLIAFSVLISFISSMTVLPALIKHLKPSFLGYQREHSYGSAIAYANQSMGKKMTNQQPKTALITGATGGIGSELCHRFASDKTNLVLVARNQRALEQVSHQLHQDYDIDCHVIALDLAVPDAARKLHQAIQRQDLKIDFLINSAGVGYYGKFSDSDLDDLGNMLNLNITALVQLTRLLLSDMLLRGSGRILNVASLAGYQPGGPNAAAYYASKSFVLAFNRALVVELKHTPITSTVFCPGPLSTAFAKQGDFAATRLYRYFSSDVGKQVTKAYRAMFKGRSTVVPGFVSKLLAIGGELPPRGIALAINKFLLQ